MYKHHATTKRVNGRLGEYDTFNFEVGECQGERRMELYLYMLMIVEWSADQPQKCLRILYSRMSFFHTSCLPRQRKFGGEFERLSLNFSSI